MRSLTDQEASWSALQEVGVLSYSGYSLFKGHSMAMRYSPNGGSHVRTIVIKLLMNYVPVYGSFLFPELQFWNILCLLENMGFECDDFMACHCWIWTDMLNYTCFFWVGA